MGKRGGRGVTYESHEHCSLTNNDDSTVIVLFHVNQGGTYVITIRRQVIVMVISNTPEHRFLEWSPHFDSFCSQDTEVLSVSK